MKHVPSCVSNWIERARAFMYDADITQPSDELKAREPRDLPMVRLGITYITWCDDRPCPSIPQRTSLTCGMR